MNAECARCGVTAADLPYEELGLDLEQASELLFDRVGDETVCNGCAQIASTEDRIKEWETTGEESSW